jgi:C-terminal processing protease CtpA/Prc
VYLNAALDIMENNSINRFMIDWPDFRQLTLERAGAAQTTADTYDAIRLAVGMLGDNHSFFVPPGASPSARVAPVMTAGVETQRPPIGALLVGNVGYVYVPAFSGSSAEADALAVDLQAIIETHDGSDRCGWIVDLRQNTGGNMWPMLAGIGPVLGEGLAGLFVDPDPAVPPQEWGYSDGESWLQGSAVVHVPAPYVLLRPEPTVAVLTDERTASSGEAIVIAFRRRPKTRAYGEPTGGLSTANRGFSLSDGALLILTVSTMADRTGQLYGSQVEPDVVVVTNLGSANDIDPTSGQDPAVEAALDWLSSDGDCMMP